VARRRVRVRGRRDGDARGEGCVRDKMRRRRRRRRDDATEETEETEETED